MKYKKVSNTLGDNFKIEFSNKTPITLICEGDYSRIFVSKLISKG